MESYASGSVHGTTATDEESFVGFGGLVGGSDRGDIEQSYALGSVTGNRAGGLIGVHWSGYIGESFAAGEVTGEDEVGGLVGVDNEATVEYAYWDRERTGQASSPGSLDEHGLSTDAMTGTTAQDALDGFDFEETWKTTNSYPQLSWQESLEEEETSQTPSQSDVEILESEYALREAGIEATVSLEGDTYHILQDMPGADRVTQRAVVTDEYDLVDLETVREVLLVEEGVERPFRYDWETELERAERERRTWLRAEVLNRAADIGWGALATYAMAQINPKGALPLATSTLQSSVGWAIDEIQGPYQETMSRMAEWTHTYETVAEECARTVRIADLSDDVFEFASLAIEAYGKIETYDEVTTVMAEAYRNSGSFTTGLHAGLTSTATFHFAVGFLAAEGADLVRAGFQRNAELAAIAGAYHTVRIPVIERILELQAQTDAGEIDPANVLELQYLISRHHSMAAFAMDGMRVQADALTSSTVGGMWDTLVNVDAIVPVLEERAKIYREGSQKAHADLGEWLSLAQSRRENSLNATVANGEGST
ncbi:hypothetical protein ACLI4U_15195 [Natrialbaceae archaeon A-CW2]